jgi:hypothetical protein
MKGSMKWNMVTCTLECCMRRIDGQGRKRLHDERGEEAGCGCGTIFIYEMVAGSDDDGLQVAIVWF